MIVTFISQCKKKALKKTRRILDSYADRIGDNTWQTVITMEGLDTVRKHLRKTASKSTAVSCHRMRGRSRFELCWIVGNRDKFNSSGIVPVHTTQKDFLHTEWENNWHYISLIKNICALAALFHDWGKASDLFQKKLCPKNGVGKHGDPIRHEWISALFFSFFVLENGTTDDEWLKALSLGDFNEEKLIKKINLLFEDEKLKNLPQNLPPLASLLVWLIVSHHKLPCLPFKDNSMRECSIGSVKDLLKFISITWGYSNNYLEEEQKKRLEKNGLVFSKGLPSQSSVWKKHSKKWALRMIENPFRNLAFDDSDVYRGIATYAHLSLVLGDHQFSSLDGDSRWYTEYPLIANTSKGGEANQKLDEHLIGVMKASLQIAHSLPLFSSNMEYARDVSSLSKTSPLRSPYHWQDKAVDAIEKWKIDCSDEIEKDSSYGFFAVNMASTGKGKTIANAKIMRALSFDGESLRYNLALGLRTLTLQTGDEYREKIGLDETELAVLIGSSAVKKLHETTKNDKIEVDDCEEEDIELSSQLDYEFPVPESCFSTVLAAKSEKERQFLFAPVVSCTIDHLMPATEVTRGGRWILPFLRLMNSDLVIDEIDDFIGNDLIAIGRLVYQAALLGRKVMISSATISPDIAEGYFKLYQQGRIVYNKMHDISTRIGCCWIDEFSTVVTSILEGDGEKSGLEYRQKHASFIKKRVAHIKKEEKEQGVRRKGYIVPCDVSTFDDFGSVCQNTIVKLHGEHHEVDKKTGKKVSFGCVRIANIKPCVALAKYFMQSDWPDSIAIKCMPYHSRQLLVLRNEQEKHLDAVLKCKKNEDRTEAFENPLIRNYLDTTLESNVIFILVATPVEEVGRDHDFDWAVVEPSSFRSIIQLAGRVRRHRKGGITTPNLALLQYNYNACFNESCDKAKKKAVFCRPGYETKKNYLVTHNLFELIDEKKIRESVNAIPRIQKKEILQPSKSLCDLEHHVLYNDLVKITNERGPESVSGWGNKSFWWMTGFPQKIKYAPFRERLENIELFYHYENGKLTFCEWNNKEIVDRECPLRIKKESLTDCEKKRIWLERNYEDILKKYADIFSLSMESISCRYGTIDLPKIYESKGLIYSDYFGLYEIIEENV